MECYRHMKNSTASQRSWLRITLKPLELSPFAAGDHMVQKPPNWRANCALGHLKQSNLKGLGHAILGNFSADRMVVELTKISK